MTRPVLLDLFCGAGGAAVGYHQAGFDVVGVDINPQPRYPFPFVKADAMTYPLDGFDAIHASPPCQDHSELSRIVGLRGTAWMLGATVERLAASGLPYVVENVPGADMPGSLVLCGSEFGLRAGQWWLKRHRRFVSNILLMGAGGCYCHGRRIMGVFGDLRAADRRTTAIGKPPKMRASVATARELLGCPWMTGPELSQAIPPAYTRFIGEQLIAHLAGCLTP